MFTGEILIAALLLCGDGETRHEETFAWTMVTRPCILCLSLKNETLDDRETRFMLGQDVLGDLDTLRGRYREFRNVPLLSEAERFPDRKTAMKSLEINRYLRKLVSDRLSVDMIHVEEIRSHVEDIDARYQVWDCVRDAHCDYYFVTVRRQSLSMLRDLIGVESYEMGRLPAPY